MVRRHTASSLCLTPREHSTGLWRRWGRFTQHEGGLVAPVRDGARPDAHSDAAAARRRAGGRLDLGRDDLDRPDAVSHLRGHGAEDLAALLRALARVGHDLDRVLADAERARGAPPRQPKVLVRVMTRHGFTWGGRWGVPDGMHFEFVDVPGMP